MIMARMARNREIMKRAPLSPQTQLTILAYLQRASNQPASVTAESEVISGKQQEELSFLRPESWLALGPFLLLVMIGLLRWGNALRRSRKLIDSTGLG